MKIYNLLLLDESGSMQAIYDATLTGCNEVLQTIRSAAADPELEQWVQFTSFNSLALRDRIPLTKATYTTLLQPNDFEPNATTPLYDAMGFTLTALEKRLEGEKDYAVLCTIITDGLENASREFDQKAIYTLIERLKAKGWSFVFIGAEYDVEKVAMHMGIQSSMRYRRNGSSTGRMFSQEVEYRKDYYERKKQDPGAPMRAFNIDVDKEGGKESGA